MNTEISFEESRIAGIEHKISGDRVSSRIKVIAVATAEIAGAIGAGWLLDGNRRVKSGFNSIGLEYTMENIRFRHVIDKVATLQVTSELATKFKVFRRDKLMVSFVVHYAGSPFELLEHSLKVGGGKGVSTLTKLQSEMFPEEKKDAAPRSKRGEQQTLAPAADVDRETSKRREKRKKSNGAILPDVVVDCRGKDEAYPD